MKLRALTIAGLMGVGISVTWPVDGKAGISLACADSDETLSGQTLAKLKADFAKPDNLVFSKVAEEVLGADVDDQFFFTLGCRLSEADPSMLQDYAGDELALSEFLARVDLSQPKNLSQSEAILEIIRLMQQAAQKPKSSTK